LGKVTGRAEKSPKHKIIAKNLEVIIKLRIFAADNDKIVYYGY
jgi:hypothetical protein